MAPVPIAISEKIICTVPSVFTKLYPSCTEESVETLSASLGAEKSISQSPVSVGFSQDFTCLWIFQIAPGSGFVPMSDENI